MIDIGMATDYPETTIGMLLDGLIRDDRLAGIDLEAPITGLALDSRKIAKGNLFTAYPGARSDGRDFALSAITEGAAAVLFDGSDAPEACMVLQRRGQGIAIENLREKVSHLASRFYRHPSRHLHIIGITGTNGKTTCAFLLTQALDKLGHRCAMSGTIGAGFIDQLKTSDLTTADAVAVQKSLFDFVRRGATAVCMEVSSHGLDQDRVSAVEVNIAILTNLTQDHLDYHDSMEKYAAAKKKLFDFPCLEEVIINNEDDLGKRICAEFQSRQSETKEGFCKLITYGEENADVRAKNIRVDDLGVSFDICWQGQSIAARSQLLGEINVANLLATTAALLAMDYSLKQIANIMPTFKAPPGRMELFRCDEHGLSVVVDYSHTPDSLERALKSLRVHSNGDLWVVFGCGGDRDIGKRAMMGNVAALHADHIVVTNDNPRTEPPEVIVAGVVKGIRSTHTQAAANFRVILDRKQAIEYAITHARSDHWVLVAGKGHETTQTVGFTKHIFSDRDVVRELQKLRARKGNQ